MIQSKIQRRGPKCPKKLDIIKPSVNYNFDMGSTVKVPVFEIRYSSIATSLPASFPYPEALIPPKGDSAADAFPVEW